MVPCYAASDPPSAHLAANASSNNAVKEVISDMRFERRRKVQWMSKDGIVGLKKESLILPEAAQWKSQTSAHKQQVENHEH